MTDVRRDICCLPLSCPATQEDGHIPGDLSLEKLADNYIKVRCGRPPRSL